MLDLDVLVWPASINIDVGQNLFGRQDWRTGVDIGNGNEVKMG